MAIAAVNPPKPAAASGLFHGTLDAKEQGDEDEDDDQSRSDLISGGKPSNGEPA